MDSHTIEFEINGKRASLEVVSHRTLLQVLREDLHLSGTKEGCGEGECGACTVLVDGRSVTACLTLAVEVDGCSVRTIEGESEGPDLSPLQEAFVKNHALQCGFCTPGMIMSARALLERNPSPTEDQIKEAIAGNLCRCTGYRPIIQAIREAAARRKDQSAKG
ncbi:MAG: (2Fe-2S)-binding protein [Candidatus Eisenbacteria sp.]|nr:(2Fe-2S)-binding protein [Candidatus Eisenbacteria bacterium]